jgi:hypothetical protein
VPKPKKWVLPEIKKGRIDIARLDIHERQVRPGKVEDFYTVTDLFLRNVNMALLHLFIMMTEPYSYLRFCIMDDWGCFPLWFTFVDTLFFPLKPLFNLTITTI